MEKTRDLFKKIRDTKGTFHENMGTIKDKNSMDLTEAEDIMCILGTFSQYLLLLLDPYHFCPLSSPSLHKMLPWYL